MGLPRYGVIMRSMWSLTIEATFFMKYVFIKSTSVGRNVGDMGQPKCTKCDSIYGIIPFYQPFDIESTG